MATAAFAPAGIAEGVAGSLLKDGLTEGGNLLGETALDGISASTKVENYIKAVAASKKAQLAGTGIADAVESATGGGLGYQEFLNYGQYLRNQGLQETDVLNEGLARRVASQGLRKAGVGPGQALRIAKGAETLVNAGFGVQMVQGALYAYPRVLDLMSKGDYDDAAEYMIEGTAGAALGTLGIAHTLYSIGDIVPGLNEKNHLALSDETETLKKVFNRMDGDLASTQVQIAARKRLHIVGLMEAAGLNVPSGLLDRIPFTEEEQAQFDKLSARPTEDLTEEQSKQLDKFRTRASNNEKTSLGGEIASAWNSILTSKEDREKLLQTQKDMFMALDSGNSRPLAHEKLMALAAGTHQEDWVRDVLKYQFIPPERTIEDIANEEKNGVLAVKADAGQNQKKIEDLTTALNTANFDLKKATPENVAVLQGNVDTLKDQINEAQLQQEVLDKKYEDARAWEDPNRQEEAFQKLYQDRIQALKEAKDTSTSFEDFNQKVRALGNYPKDLSLIEDKYPHFRNQEDKFSPEATLEPSLNRFFNLHREYENRLEDPSLVEVSPGITTPGGPMLAVPVGGSRVAGGGEPPRPPGPPEPEWDGDWRKLFPPSTINGGATEAIPTEPWQDGPQHPALPADLVDRVNKAKARNYTPEQISYIQSILKSYAHVAQGLNPQELKLYNSLREADDNNWTAAYNNGIVHSIVDNHIHHIWGNDPKKGYPSEAQARSGAFAINASQARHRSWATAFEGILDGRQLAVHDPASIIASDADTAAQAAAHRKALEILAKGTNGVTLKDPEGMPILSFRGMGRVVPGEDGSPSSILVNPNVVKNIIMTPGDIQRLTASGLLDTYLKDGRVVDRTPSVGLGNVQEWILATKKKIDKLIETNPLLGSPQEKLRHEEGWKQLQSFTSSQSSKIAEYIENALEKLKAGPIDSKGNFAALPELDKPTDPALVKYLGDVLHGKNRRITPSEFAKLEQYAEMNRNYADGLNGKGEGPIRPSEIAKIAKQEKANLPPELSKYLDEIHDIFGKRDDSGEWSVKGINSAVYHIAHAAENTAYPQLMQDLSDLKYVDNIYSSANPITQAQHKAEAAERLKGINDRQPKQYLWAPKSHIPIDHPSFHGYKWMASAEDGTPTLAESDMAVSRHYYQYMVNRLGLKPSWLREETGLGKITAPLLKGGAAIKSTILSGSPFHVIQIALRALMLHVNPFVRPNPISDIDEKFTTPSGRTSTLRKGVENSLTVFNDKNAAEDYSVGVASHGGLLSKIPIYGPFTDQLHDFLFNRFIPAMKADAYKKMYAQYGDAHPEWTDDAVAYHAAQHTNNAFGGINWREMGRSSTTQDWFNLVALAPDWLESEMRFASQLFNGYGVGPAKYQRDSGKNFTRIQVGQAAVVLWATARLLNQLYSGNSHLESPFGLVVKDKDGRDIEYSVRTLPTDILHAATDPYGFLVGRTSPLVRTGQELVTGRNQYGQKLTDSEKYVDMISNLVPIWGQSGLKNATKLATASDVGFPEQVAKASGATAQVLRTPAQKTAANLASERSEEGSITPAQIARHRILLQIEDNLRDGRIKVQDVQNMVDQGTLPESDAKAAIKNVKETFELDPEEARMYSRVSRLDLPGALAVYEDSNPTEKTFLHPLILKKSKAYVKKSLTDETPATRAVDPYFKRARQFAPVAQ